MSRVNSTPHWFNATLDSTIWCGYLVLLFAASFINNMFPSELWLMASCAVFLLVALQCVNILAGEVRFRPAYKAALPALILCGLMLVWLALQTWMASNNYLHEFFLASKIESASTPEWFQPEFRWSIVPDKTRWLFLSELMMVAVFFLTIVLVNSRTRIHQLLYTMVVVGLVHALAGILAKYSGVSLVDLSQVDGHFTVARGLFVNRNHYAAFISLTLIGALAIQFRHFFSMRDATPGKMLVEQMISPKVLILICIIVMVVAMVLSQSRAGFLGLVTALLITLMAIGRHVHRFGGRRKVIIPTLVILAGVMIYFGHDLLVRFGNEAEVFGERGAQWVVTLNAIKHRMLLGYGGDSYATVFQMVRGYTDFRQVLYNQAHNDYLHIWLEQGLIGLVLWLSLLLYTLRTAYKSFLLTRSSLVSSCLLAAAMVIIAAMLQSFVDFNLQIPNIRWYFFVIIATVFAVPAAGYRCVE